MRRVRYLVAMSLDGYIAGPNGEADWIIMDPEIDFQGRSRARTSGYLAEVRSSAASWKLG